MSERGKSRKCSCLHGTSVVPSSADVARPRAKFILLLVSQNAILIALSSRNSLACSRASSLGRVLTNRLITAVAEACVAKLFELDGSLVWLKDGQLVEVTRPILLEIITTLIAGVRLVNRGVADQPVWEAEFFPYRFAPGADTGKEPNDKVLTSLMGGLLLRVAKGPSAPSRLTPQQQFEVQARLARWRRCRHHQTAGALIPFDGRGRRRGVWLPHPCTRQRRWHSTSLKFNGSIIRQAVRPRGKRRDQRAC
jgi:hypothetical protein